MHPVRRVATVIQTVTKSSSYRRSPDARLWALVNAISPQYSRMRSMQEYWTRDRFRPGGKHSMQQRTASISQPFLARLYGLSLT